jgi:hypothetical protein
MLRPGLARSSNPTFAVVARIECTSRAYVRRDGKLTSEQPTIESSSGAVFGTDGGAGLSAKVQLGDARLLTLCDRTTSIFEDLAHGKECDRSSPRCPGDCADQQCACAR